MNKDYSVTFKPNKDLDGAMCETEESMKGRICRLFGFESRSLSMQDGDLKSAEIAWTGCCAARRSWPTSSARSA